MFINNPLTGSEAHVATVLTMLASQENCDGVPYDQMTLAAEYIMKLEERVACLQEIASIYRSRLERGA